MKHNQVPTMSSVHLLAVAYTATPPAPTPAGGIPPLSSAPPQVGNRLSIRIEKYGPNDIVNYPSLESYIRQTFTHPVIKGDLAGVAIHCARAANLIAQRTRRGAGQTVYTSPTSVIQPTTPGKFGYSMKHDHLDWLGDNEAFVAYGDTVLDSGFVWMPKDDGTIDVVSLPVTAINEVKGYGQFVSV